MPGKAAMKSGAVGRLQRFIHAAPRRLASARVGALLLIATFGFTLLAAFFPANEAAGFVRSLGQALALDNLAAAYQLTFEERFQSPTFLLLIAAVSLSLVFSLYFRIRGEFKRRTLEIPPGAAAPPRSGAVGIAIAGVARELRRRGYQTRAACAAGSWQVHASKGGGGVWGSVLFHVSILLLIAAVVLNSMASFAASVKLTEGQAFDARSDSYGKKNAGRWYTPPAQPLTFRLVRVEPDYEADGTETVASIVEPTLEGKRSRFTPPAPVGLLNGLRHAGVTIHQGKETGFAPQVTINDAAGKSVLDGYTRLATLSGPEKVSYADYVEIPDKDKKVRAEFELLPDAVFRDGAYLNRSGVLKNPVLHVKVREQDKIVFDEFIPVTREFSGGGYTVSFGEVRRWSQLDFTDAPGVPVLIAATLFGSLGLLLRLLSVRRRIVVSLTGTDVNQAVAFEVAGTSEKFPRTFQEELDSIRAALAPQLATKHDGELIAQGG